MPAVPGGVCIKLSQIAPGMSLLRLYLSHRLVWLAVLVSLGIAALFAQVIVSMRSDDWAHAEQTNANLARSISQSIGWSLDSFDQSMRGVVTELGRPEVMALPPALRARVLFDNSLRSKGAGDIVVTDAQGNVVLDSAHLTPRKANLADRDYFRAFQTGGHQGLFVGGPITSRITGLNILPLSRAYYRPDGSFAGVVVGAIRLSFFNELFSSVDLGANSGVNFFATNGTVISRFPYGDLDVGRSIAGTENLQRFLAASSGTFSSLAVLDGVQRIFAFEHVSGYPLFVSVAQATDTVLARWRQTAWTLGIFTALLMVGILGLATLFVRELLLRQQVSVRLREAENDVRTILNNLPSMVSYWDHALHNRFANQACEAWFGIAPDALRGTHISESLDTTLYAQHRAKLDWAMQGQAQLFEWTLTDVHGTLRHTIVSFQPDQDGDVVRGIFVQITDISDRKRMENELFDEKERMRLTLSSIGDAVLCTDALGRITYLNPVAERLTGWQAFDAAGRDVDEVINLRDADSGAPTPSPVRAAMRAGAAVEPVRGVVVHRTSSQRFDVEETASAITDRHGAVSGAVTVLRDVTEAVVMAARMTHLAQYDALTDLPNRVLLQDRAQLAITQARRDDKRLALMYLDLDGFKAINDRHGHAVGDQLLVQFAQRLQAAVRASDTVCRQGGDEFVVLLPGLDGDEPACVVARKILAACEAPFELAGERLAVGLSGGIALYPQHGTTFDALSRHADSAMYAAKRAGRMRFMIYRGDGEAPEAVLPMPAGAVVS